MPWLGVWGEGTPRAEEDCRGRGVMRRGGTLHPPRPRAPAATRQAPPFLLNEGQVSPVGVGRGSGGRESWRAAHLLSLNLGEAKEDTHLLLPHHGFGDGKMGLCVPSSGHPGSVLLLLPHGLRPVRSLFTGRSGVRDWLRFLPVPFQVRWPTWKTGGRGRVKF